MKVQGVVNGLAAVRLTPRECALLAEACYELAGRYVWADQAGTYDTLETYGALLEALGVAAGLEVEMGEALLGQWKERI